MSEQAAEHWIVYPIGSKPTWPMAVLLGIQQYLTMFGATVLIPFIVGGAIKMPQEQLALMISTIFFTSGICTLIQQSPIGNKLPIIQGGTFSFLGPTFAIIGMVAAKGATGAPLWQLQIQEIAGAIMIASVVEIFLGYTGIMGQVKKIISPIVIGPTIAMIGLMFFNIGAPWMAKNWVISLITLGAMVLYSQVLSQKSKVFMLFPVLLAIATGWICSLIGTLAGWIPPGDPAFLKTDLIVAAPWFDLMPMMPFKWGMPDWGSTTLWAGALGMLAGYMSSMIESIGDYYACARISEAPVPTGKMISRGLGAEGLGCLIAGIMQTGNGTTSYSENVGSIGLTKVASRRVVRAGACIMLVIAIIGKFGAVLATIPHPVVGAMFFALFGMIASVGLSNLQIVNLNNSRNLFVVGIAFFAGLSVPYQFNTMLSASAAPLALGNVTFNVVTAFFWVIAAILLISLILQKGEKPKGLIIAFVLFVIFALISMFFFPMKQSNELIGNIFQAILTTGMAVTAIVGILLDNLLPGATRAERGLEVWETEASDEAWEKAEAEWAAIPEGEMRAV